MAIEKVKALAIVSGKGGVGKSLLALNLAIGLGKNGFKTLLYDAAGGNLAIMSNTTQPFLSNNQAINGNLGENVSLHVSSLRNPCLVTNSKGIRSLLQEIIGVVPGFKCVVFDCPTGVNAISQTLAGLSEKVALVSTSDPTSIAGAYIVARAFEKERLGGRIGLLFNQVANIDEAVSLKTRFDILSNSFLKCRFDDFGYVRKDDTLASSIREQYPVIQSEIDSPGAADIMTIAQNLFSHKVFQNETIRPITSTVFRN
jgi:flagellar biosynthesis protein FlhG